MCVSRRIDEVVALLEAYALGEVDLPKPRIKAALALLNLMVADAQPPDDDGDEAPALADDPDVVVYPPQFAA